MEAPEEDLAPEVEPEEEEVASVVEAVPVEDSLAVEVLVEVLGLEVVPVEVSEVVVEDAAVSSFCMLQVLVL